MYKILGTDQKEYGPVSADLLRRWISERRANSQTRVQAEGSTEWKPLSEFPEFNEALAAGAAPPNLPGPPPSPATLPRMSAPAKTSGLAIASLILGILGFCTGITALFGLILGLVALIKINNSQGKLSGQGLAIAGMCISGLLILILPGLMLPALAKAKTRAQSINCVNNLKQIGTAAQMYASDHQETFPQDFLSLSNLLLSPKVLVCPVDRTKTKVSDWSSLSPENITYELVAPGTKESFSRSKVLVRCPIHGHVCLSDGSVVRGDARERPMKGDARERY